MYAEGSLVVEESMMNIRTLPWEVHEIHVVVVGCHILYLRLRRCSLEEDVARHLILYIQALSTAVGTALVTVGIDGVVWIDWASVLVIDRIAAWGICIIGTVPTGSPTAIFCCLYGLVWVRSVSDGICAACGYVVVTI